MKNVLVIVYYFPPMGGSGVQRPLKFVKYMRDFGWNPIVLCPEPGAYHIFDESLQEELDSFNIEVHRVPGNTPLHTSGERLVKLPKFIENPLRRISGFFWLPDNKKGWIKPGFEKAIELIREKEIEVVFSTAAPYSNLVLAARLKKETGVKVVMDLRDEWLESHLITYPSRWHRRKMADIERQTLSQADVITVINESYKESFGKRFPEQEIQVVQHGFDPGDFEGVFKEESGEKLRLLYSGLFYGERTPGLFFEAVKEIIRDEPSVRKKLELQFQGGLDEATRSGIQQSVLKDMVVDFGYVQHKQAVYNLMQADVLWLMIGHLHHSDKVTLGKMFEYFGTGKPILALIPEGKSAEMLAEYGAVYKAHPASKKEIKSAIRTLLEDFEKGELPKPDKEFVAQFNRKKITEQLTSVFNVISS